MDFLFSVELFQGIYRLLGRVPCPCSVLCSLRWMILRTADYKSKESRPLCPGFSKCSRITSFTTELILDPWWHWYLKWIRKNKFPAKFEICSSACSSSPCLKFWFRLKNFPFKHPLINLIYTKLYSYILFSTFQHEILKDNNTENIRNFIILVSLFSKYVWSVIVICEVFVI